MSSNTTPSRKPAGLKLLELEHGRAYHEIDNALLLAGKTDDEIAETFGVSVATVKNYRKRLGYKPARCLVPAS